MTFLPRPLLAFQVHHRDWLAYAAIVVLTTLTLIIALQVPLSRLDVPYTFNGDAVDKVAQIETVAETGWLFHNPRLGFPFGYDRLDFPRFDSLNYVVMGPLAAVSGQPGLAMNLYFLAGYYLIGLAALFVFRRLGLAIGPALLCALAFAFLPYHQLRGVSHLTNGAYFLIPLAMLVLVWIARAALDPASPGARGRWLLALATAALLPLQTPYNGVFFAALCPVACAIALASNARWRNLWPALVLLFAVSGSFLAEQVPALLHKAEDGVNVNVASRSAQESEMYSLHLNEIVLPYSKHRVDALAKAKRGFDEALGTPRAEFQNQYIGVIGVLGLFALLWALVRTVNTNRDETTELERNVRIFALLAIAILMLAISSGLLTIASHWVSTKIRASNRIFPFLAFCALLGSGWLVQGALARVRWPALRGVALVGIGLLVLADLTTPTLFKNRERNVATFDADRTYFQQVEQRLEPGAAVFQLPAVWYPEHPPILRMADYDEFKPFLFTRTLKFSYGSAQGRPGFAWSNTVGALPPDQMIERVHSRGFSAILIDANAYSAEQLQTLTSGLGKRLSEAAQTSANQRWWLFPLAGCCQGSKAAPAPAANVKAFPYVADGTPLSFASGGLGGLYRAGGWAPMESWGLWSLGSSAQLRMQLVVPADTPLALTLKLQALIGPKVPLRHVSFEYNGQLLGEADFDRDTPLRELRFNLPPGLVAPDGQIQLTFRISPTASPKTAGLSDDWRQLGIGLISLAIGPAATLPP